MKPFYKNNKNIVSQFVAKKKGREKLLKKKGNMTIVYSDITK